jgi:hypothetical protein
MNNLPDRRDYPDRRQQQQQRSPWPDPQWVIVGIDLPDGRVRVIASDKLLQADLKIDYDWLNLQDPSFTVGISMVTRYQVTLTLKMLELRIVDADDYATAIAKLFGNWTPHRRIAIER